MTLNKARDRVFTSVVSFCKLILSTMKKVLEYNAISGKDSYAIFLFFKQTSLLNGL